MTCDAHFHTQQNYSSQKSCVKMWFGLVEPFKSYRGNIRKKKKINKSIKQNQTQLKKIGFLQPHNNVFSDSGKGHKFIQRSSKNSFISAHNQPTAFMIFPSSCINTFNAQPIFGRKKKKKKKKKKKRKFYSYFGFYARERSFK